MSQRIKESFQNKVLTISSSSKRVYNSVAFWPILDKLSKIPHLVEHELERISFVFCVQIICIGSDWSLGIDKQFYPTLNKGCNYLSMLGLTLIHVSKRRQCWKIRRILPTLPIKTWHMCIVHWIVLMHIVLNLPMVIIKTSLKIIARLRCFLYSSLWSNRCFGAFIMHPVHVRDYARDILQALFCRVYQLFQARFYIKRLCSILVNGSVFFLFRYQMSALHPGNVYVTFLFLRNACISWKLFF